MASVIDRLPRNSRVAILRFRSLGDCVLTTPAIQLLHNYRPDLRIGVSVEDRFREIFDGHPAVHEVLAPTITAVRRFRPLLCLNFHGGTRSAWMTLLSGAQYRAGFGHYRNQFAYNLRIPRAQEILGLERKVHTAEHLASAMFYLGVPRTGIPRARTAGLPAGHPAGRLAIFHAVAATPEKTWPAERFLEIARHLAAHGLEPVFIGAAADDLSPFRAYRVQTGLPLREVNQLLSQAALFVGNDSGPAHMAAACGLPVIVLFGSSDPEIWGPWQTAGEALHDPNGIAAIPVERVIQALQRLRVPA